MACFIVPGTEAIVTTAITKIVEKKEKKEICSCETEGAVEAVKEEKALPFSRKLKWLNNMLWGGTALLAFEHVWHGEVTPFFPFLTEKESTSGTDTLALSRHMPIRKNVITNMQLNSLLKLFFIRTSPFQSESHLLYYIIFSRGNKEKIYVKMYILQCLTIQCEIGKIHINICIFEHKNAL